MRAETLLMAKEFWALAGDPGSFPRNIERAVALALPIALVKLPRVTRASLTAWLRDRGIEVLVPACVDDMSGCLIAHRGHAVIFVCAADPECEGRATGAHELAHFIIHYIAPRERALQAFGPAILEVLDGDRPLAFADRAKGAILGVNLGAHVHVLPRADRMAMVDEVERQADELALQLLAPRDVVLQCLSDQALSAVPPQQRRTILGARFGLPSTWFADYVPDSHPRTDTVGSIFTRLRRTNA